MTEGTSPEGDMELEAKAFDRQATQRAELGLYPDAQNLRVVEGLYNNPWREPEFFHLQIMPRIRFVLDAIAGRPGRVLEVGCGVGYLSLEMARGGHQVLGMDVSAGALEIASQVADAGLGAGQRGRLEYRQGDFLEADLELGSFDSVVFMGALHHFHDVGQALDRVAALLGPGGNLVACEPVVANFTHQSAQMAALLRALCPTWVDYGEKLDGLNSAEAWDRYVQEIYLEYTYQDAKGEKVQSPHDDATCSEELMVGAVKDRFNLVELQHTDAFMDKLVGGLRGPDRHRLAAFLKFVDGEMVRRGILPATSIRVHAVKAGVR